jgi:hypothetical protein
LEGCNLGFIGAIGCKSFRAAEPGVLAPKEIMPLEMLGKILSFCSQLSNLRIRSRLGVEYLGLLPLEYTFMTISR